MDVVQLQQVIREQAQELLIMRQNQLILSKREGGSGNAQLMLDLRLQLENVKQRYQSFTKQIRQLLNQQEL